MSHPRLASASRFKYFARQIQCCIALSLYLVGSSALSANDQVNAEQLRFVTTNAEFTLLHEMGHLLIHELKLPILGREEDAADQLGFIGLFLIYDRQQTPDFPHAFTGCCRLLAP